MSRKEGSVSSSRANIGQNESQYEENFSGVPRRVQKLKSEIKNCLRYTNSENTAPEDGYFTKLKNSVNELSRRTKLAQQSLDYLTCIVVSYLKHCFEQIKTQGMSLDSDAFRTIAADLNTWYVDLKRHYNLFRYLNTGYVQYAWQQAIDKPESTYEHVENNCCISKYGIYAVQEDITICKFFLKQLMAKEGPILGDIRKSHIKGITTDVNKLQNDVDSIYHAIDTAMDDRIPKAFRDMHEYLVYFFNGIFNYCHFSSASDMYKRIDAGDTYFEVKEGIPITSAKVLISISAAADCETIGPCSPFPTARVLPLQEFKANSTPPVWYAGSGTDTNPIDLLDKTPTHTLFQFRTKVYEATNNSQKQKLPVEVVPKAGRLKRDGVSVVAVGDNDNNTSKNVNTLLLMTYIKNGAFREDLHPLIGRKATTKDPRKPGNVLKGVVYEVQNKKFSIVWNDGTTTKNLSATETKYNFPKGAAEFTGSANWDHDFPMLPRRETVQTISERSGDSAAMTKNNGTNAIAPSVVMMDNGSSTSLTSSLNKKRTRDANDETTTTLCDNLDEVNDSTDHIPATNGVEQRQQERALDDLVDSPIPQQSMPFTLSSITRHQPLFSAAGSPHNSTDITTQALEMRAEAAGVFSDLMPSNVTNQQKQELRAAFRTFMEGLAVNLATLLQVQSSVDTLVTDFTDFAMYTLNGNDPVIINFQGTAVALIQLLYDAFTEEAIERAEDEELRVLSGGNMAIKDNDQLPVILPPVPTIGNGSLNMDSSISSESTAKRRRKSEKEIKKRNILPNSKKNVIYSTIRKACLQLGERMLDSFARYELAAAARKAAESGIVQSESVSAITIARYFSYIAEKGDTEKLDRFMDAILPEGAPFNLDLVQLATSLRYAKSLKDKAARKLCLDIMTYPDRANNKKVYAKVLIDSARKLLNIKTPLTTPLIEPELASMSVKKSKKKKKTSRFKDSDDDRDDEDDNFNELDDTNMKAPNKPLTTGEVEKLHKAIAQMAPQYNIVQRSDDIAGAVKVNPQVQRSAPPTDEAKDRIWSDMELFSSLKHHSDYWQLTNSVFGVTVKMGLPLNQRFYNLILSQLREYSDARFNGIMQGPEFQGKVRKLVATMMTFRIDFSHDDLLYDQTPPSGFCCYLAHLQYIKYWESQNWDSWEKIDWGYSYTTEFAEQLQADIDHWQKHYDELNPGNCRPTLHNALPHPMIDCIPQMIEKLQLALKFVQDPQNKKKNLFYNNEEADFGGVKGSKATTTAPTRRWGGTGEQGLLFVHRCSVPVVICERNDNEPNRAVVKTFFPRTSQTMPREQPEHILYAFMTVREINKLFNSIGQAKYGILFDVTGKHYHGIKLPREFSTVTFDLIERITEAFVEVVGKTVFSDDLKLVTSPSTTTHSLIDLVEDESNKPPIPQAAANFESLSSSSMLSEKKIKKKGYVIDEETYVQLKELWDLLSSSSSKANGTESSNNRIKSRSSPAAASNRSTADQKKLTEVLSQVVNGAILTEIDLLDGDQEKTTAMDLD